MIRIKTLMLLPVLVAAGCATQQASRTDWYYFDWMADSPSSPVFHVRDTESGLGPYAKKTKALTLKDLVKMHGLV